MHFDKNCVMPCQIIGVPSDLVKFSEVKCTLVTLELFDKLKIGNKIVRDSGAIVKCMPQYIKAESRPGDQGFDIEVADNLRKVQKCYLKIQFPFLSTQVPEMSKLQLFILHFCIVSTRR